MKTRILMEGRLGFTAKKSGIVALIFAVLALPYGGMTVEAVGAGDSPLRAVSAARADASASPEAGMGEELSFLRDYVDAVRVGDWFLACVKATRPEARFDSATRNTTAPWVLLDEAGRVLAEDLYWWPRDDAWPLQPRPFEGFADGVDAAVVRINQKYGLIHRSGKLVAEAVYDDLFGFNPGETTCPAEKDGRWGCIDAAGNVVVPMRYDSSFPAFVDGLTVVSRNGRQALLAEDGTERLPADYDVVWLDGDAPFGMARRGDACALFDRDGRVLFERALGEDGWIFCSRDAEPPFAFYNSDDKTYGYLNLDGEPVLGGPYDFAAAFEKGVETASVSVDGRWGRMRRDGSFAIPAEYDWIGSPSEGLIPAQQGELYGYLDEAGNVAIPFQFGGAGDFSRGYADAWPRDDGNLHGLIDRTGRWVIAPMACEQVAVGPDGVAVACTGSRLEAFFRVTEAGAEPIQGLGRPDGGMEGLLPNEDAWALAVPEGEATLRLRASEKARLPHLDGDSRLYPLYAACVAAVYPPEVRRERWDAGENPILTASDGDNPWQRLLDGDADVIFIPAPDPKASVWATLAARGLTVDFIPLCRDALVFPVNADNPVESLSVHQLKQIYAGEIDDWADAGAPGLGAVVAYQDEEDSDGRAAFQRLCGLEEMMDAPEGVLSYEGWFPDVCLGPAAYRNLPNALGYALRSRCAGLTAGGAVRLLRVDGVAPTDENIASGAYPFAETLYAVVLKDNHNPNVRALLDWLQSEQGRELAAGSGFAALAEGAQG